VIARLRQEDGIGLPLMMGVLLLAVILGGWVASASSDSHVSAERDRSAKRAFGAADAGLARAAWRLAQAPSVGADRCLTSAATTASGTAQETIAPVVGGACPAPVAASLGNGASYTFTVTPENTAATTCAGEPSAAGERCVTATGTVAGISRRVQARLVRAGGELTFAHVGLIGRSSVDLGNSVEAFICSGESGGVVGSNGEIGLGNSIKLGDSGCGGGGKWGVQYMSPGGSVDGTAEGDPPITTIPPPGFVLPPIDFSGPAAANDNALLTGPAFQWAPGRVRELTIRSTTELRGGTYYLCSLILDGGNFSVRAGEVARIYVDSPDRAGSGCMAQSGGFWAKNGENVNFGSGDVTSAEPAERAPRLQVYVHGSTYWETTTRPCNGNKGGSVLICNSNQVAGTFYVPGGKVVLSNAVEFVGAVAADHLMVENSVKFRLPNGLAPSLLGVTPGDAVVRRWTECPARATGTAC
jgi:Tfp pilus assembly protein PilX